MELVHSDPAHAITPATRRSPGAYAVARVEALKTVHPRGRLPPQLVQSLSPWRRSPPGAWLCGEQVVVVCYHRSAQYPKHTTTTKEHDLRPSHTCRVLASEATALPTASAQTLGLGGRHIDQTAAWEQAISETKERIASRS